MKTRSIVLLLPGVILGAAACRTRIPARRDAAPIVIAVPPTASATVSPPVVRPRLDDDAGSATSWTDPSLVARLAEDCRWAPSWLDQALGEGESRHPLSCTLEIVQSCYPDLCFEEDEDTCKPKCVSECGACNTRCVTSCEGCKATCTDPACKAGCAARCGACRDDCLRAEDRCRTGTCGAAVAACNAKLKAEWKKSTCPKVCSRVRDCGKACWGTEDPQACAAVCKARLMTGCPDHFYTYCLFDAAP